MRLAGRTSPEWLFDTPVQYSRAMTGKDEGFEGTLHVPFFWVMDDGTTLAGSIEGLGSVGHKQELTAAMKN